MKLPYGYVLINEEIVVHEETADSALSTAFNKYGSAEPWQSKGSVRSAYAVYVNSPSPYTAAKS